MPILLKILKLTHLTNMNIKIKILIIAGILFVSGFIIAAEADINYPVEELGGCKDKQGCKAYCGNPENSEVCFSFAEKNNLMSDQEVKIARKFVKGEIKGPGGCKDKDSCEEYCNDISKIDECIFFAEKNNLIPPEELEEAKKVQAAIARGAKPPPCGNKKTCDVYCEEPEHMEECIAFGLEAGFIQGKEAEDAQKMMQAVKRGIKPPPCRGREACDEYCSSPDNMEVCMNFAMEAGFMNEQEKADSQKMLQAIKKGVKPPPCRGRKECDAYCGQEDHLEECMSFAVAAGFMNEKDAEMARKTGGKGPGGCKGKEECEALCNNPDNQETCFNFAKDNGMIPEEELKKMEEGKQQFQQTLQQMPQEVSDCLQGEIGAEMVEKMKNGVMPPRDLEQKMRGCFEKMGPPRGQEGEFEKEMRPPCEGEDCKKFQPRPGQENPGGQIMPQQAGPGGCKGPEECQKFCENNPEECKNFRQQEAPRNAPNGERGFKKGNKFCQGPDCKYDNPPLREGQLSPCEGENCKFGPPPPCEGENCRQGPPQGEFRPTEGQRPPEGQQFGPPSGDQMQQPSAPEQQSAPASSESPPPPPPPPGAFFKPESFLGSVLYVIAKALYSVR